MEIATESELIIWLKEVISIEHGLLEAGFVTDPHTSLLYWHPMTVRLGRGPEVGLSCRPWEAP